MKKLLIIALILIVGCARYEDRGKSQPSGFRGVPFDSRFDTWKGQPEWFVDFNDTQEWMTQKEFNKWNKKRKESLD
jgi:hypothetical protein